MDGQVLNLLFLGGAKRTSLAEHFIEVGKKRGIDIKIFSYELDRYVPIAEVAEVIVGLKWRDEKILDHLTKVIKKHDIKIVLAFVDPAIVIATQLSKLFPTLFIPVSEESICRTMFDKVSANNWFIQNKFPVPANDSTAWPKIAKPRYGSASKGLIVLNDSDALQRFEAEHNVTDYLLQDYIVASEYTVDCYVGKNDCIISVVPRMRLEVSGGEATKSITEREPLIIELSRQILSAGHFTGPITIQFLKREVDQAIFVMEINPRLGGGVLTSIASGADIVEYLLNDYENIPNVPFDTWKEKLLMVRAFREFYFYADNN